jgi:hypothetical protein
MRRQEALQVLSWFLCLVLKRMIRLGRYTNIEIEICDECFYNVSFYDHFISCDLALSFLCQAYPNATFVSNTRRIPPFGPFHFLG